MGRIALTASLLVASTAHAGVVNVTTVNELTTAITNAKPGDEILLANGTYALTGISCSANGTAAQPIVVRAPTPLGAHIELDALEGFRVTGANWHFEGLDITGVCANDSDCEHAFHVSGAAHGFVLRFSRVMNFNAQLKVNAGLIGSTYVTPNNGLIEYNELGDSHGRDTANPVTKLNIDTGEDWVVRGNYLHDAYKLQGDGTSYAAFMKSGSKRGLFERNLVVCSHVTTGGTRIGLSFGGGGTGAQYCAPAFDPNVPCSVEHDGGTMRNNIIANCSDVGIYLNRAKDSHVLFNTLIGTTGVDFRFDTTSGEAVGNLLTSMIRTRDGAALSESGNQMNVATSQFAAWYRAPLDGDLAIIGDVTALIGSAPMRTDVKNDYCAALRPSGALTMGALEHSVMPQCDTTFPPTGVVDPTGDGALGGDAGTSGGGGGGGCCQAPGRPDALPVVLVLLVLGWRRRFVTRSA
ncbi:MAG TPA: chondroitinase-B domain-containing protein [Kofleriaceae bacterium]